MYEHVRKGLWKLHARDVPAPPDNWEPHASDVDPALVASSTDLGPIATAIIEEWTKPTLAEKDLPTHSEICREGLV